MGKLYSMLCIVTVMLVSLPAICGSDAEMAGKRKAVAGENRDHGLGSVPPYNQSKKHPSLQQLRKPAHAYRVADAKNEGSACELHADAALNCP